MMTSIFIFKNWNKELNDALSENRFHVKNIHFFTSKKYF